MSRTYVLTTLQPLRVHTGSIVAPMSRRSAPGLQMAIAACSALSAVLHTRNESASILPTG